MLLNGTMVLMLSNVTLVIEMSPGSSINYITPMSVSRRAYAISGNVGDVIIARCVRICSNLTSSMTNPELLLHMYLN